MSQDTADCTPDLVVLEGSPSEIGRTLGEMWAEDLVADTEDYFRRMKEAGLEADTLLREGEAYIRVLERVAPHLAEELQATGAAAGIEADRHTAYTGLKYCNLERIQQEEEWLEPREGCTSYMAIGSASGLEANLVHKNRDARQVPQAPVIRHVSGKHRVLGSSDVGDLGLCHALNSEGLAAKTNTGDPVDIPLRKTISNTEILRLVAETCATCEEAVDAMRFYSDRGLISNSNRGCIWLFADRQRGVIVEEAPFKIAWRFIENDVDARQNEFKLPEMTGNRPEAIRYRLALDKVTELRGRVAPADLNALSRSTENHPTSICHDATNSTTTSVLPFDRRRPAYWEMTCGHPNNTFFIPVSPDARGIPRVLADGTMWRMARKLHEANPLGPNPKLEFDAVETRFRERHAAANGTEALTNALLENVREAVALTQNHSTY
jgi:hypothetical protein